MKYLGVYCALHFTVKSRIMLKSTMQIAILVLMLGVATNVVAQEVLAGTMHWMPTDTQNEIFVKYKLVWSATALACHKRPNCTADTIRNATSVTSVGSFSSSKWVCAAGCTGNVTSNLNSLVFTTFGELLEDRWTTGEGAFTYTVTPKSDQSHKFSIRLTNTSNNDTILRGEINLDKRNDTGRSNVSPAAGTIPIYRVPFGCNADIHIFTFDGDGDDVRCRLKLKVNSTSKPTLEKKTCVLHINANKENGFLKGNTYMYDLVLEDYSQSAVNFENSSKTTFGPFSQVPVQIYVRIGSSSPVCFGPRFPKGNMENGLVASFSDHNVYRSRIAFWVRGLSNRIITSGLRRLALISESSHSSTKISQLGLWTIVNDTAATGISVVCGAAYTSIGYGGVMGEQRCVVLLVGDVDECRPSSPCEDNGICRNLWHRYTCPEHPQTPTTLSSSAQSVQPELLLSEDSNKVGLIAGLSVGLITLAGGFAAAVLLMYKKWKFWKCLHQKVNAGEDTPKKPEDEPSPNKDSTKKEEEREADDRKDSA